MKNIWKISTVLCLLLILPSKHCFGGGIFRYAMVTASVEPTGSGTVYVCDDGQNSDQGKTYSAQSVGGNAKIGNGDVEVYFFSKPGTGYQFNGWYQDQAHQTRLSDEQNATITYTVSTTGTGQSNASTYNIYAYFTPIPYTITFSANDGSGTAPATMNYNIESPDFQLNANTFTRTAYTFNGWKPSSSVGNWNTSDSFADQGTVTKGHHGDVTLNAQWTPITYTIHFAAGDHGSGSMSDATYNIAGTGSTTAVPTSTFTADNGYKFSGWKVTSTTAGSWTQNDPVSAGTSLTGKYGDVTLTAQWTPIEYTITYNADGGTLSSAGDQTYNIESTSTVKTATKTDYTLKGWEVTATAGNWPAVGGTVSAGTSLTGKYGNVSLKAVWGPLKADVTISVSGLAEGETIMFTVKKDNVTLYTVPVTGKASGSASVTIKDLPTGSGYSVAPVQGWNFAYNGMNQTDTFSLGTSGETCSFTLTKKSSVKKYDEQSKVNWGL